MHRMRGELSCHTDIPHAAMKKDDYWDSIKPPQPNILTAGFKHSYMKGLVVDEDELQEMFSKKQDPVTDTTKGEPESVDKIIQDYCTE